MNIMQKVSSLLFLLLLFGCGGSGQLPPAAYVRHLESADHAYLRQVVAGSYEYTIQLATPEYMACKEDWDSDSARQARISELKPYRFFLIRMRATEAQRKAAGGAMDAQRVMEADAMVAYYDQQAAGDISLRSGTQLLHPATYHFEHNYGLAPHNTIVVAFETGDEEQDLELVFQDRFRNIPQIKAGFSKSDLEALPSLKM